MPLGQPTVRLFLLAVAAALPPLILAAILLLEPPAWPWLSPASGLVIFALLSAAWWAIVSIVWARGLGEDVSAMVELAERLRASPIQGGVKEVAWATVQTAVSVMHDATWTLAVLRSPSEAALPRG